MKKILALLVVSILTGCASTSVPIVPKFPEAPADLLTTCSDLTQLDPAQTKELSQVLTGVTENYAQYYNCKVKVDDWIEWYNSQKDVFNKIK